MYFMELILILIQACMLSQAHRLYKYQQKLDTLYNIDKMDVKSIGVEDIQSYSLAMMRRFLPDSYKSALRKASEHMNNLIDSISAMVDKATENVSYDEYDDSKAGKIIQTGTWSELADYVDKTGGFLNVFAKKGNLLFYSVIFQKYDFFKKLLQYGFSVDSYVPGYGNRIYDVLYAMKSTPIRDNMLKMAYIMSRKVVNERYRPMFKVRGWQVDAIKMMRENDFIYVERLLERHNADVRNVILNQGMFIHSAVINDCPNCIRALLKHGADPNIPYFGTYQLTKHILEEKDLDISEYSPLMIAVAMGSKRCVNALLESPLIEVTRGKINDRFQTTRDIARGIKDVSERSKFLKRLHARPADSKTLSEWLNDIDLQSLSLAEAIKQDKRHHVEFFFFNVEIQNINPEWLFAAAEHAEMVIFRVIINEFRSAIPNLCSNLIDQMMQKTVKHKEKKLKILEVIKEELEKEAAMSGSAPLCPTPSINV